MTFCLTFAEIFETSQSCHPNIEARIHYTRSSILKNMNDSRMYSSPLLTIASQRSSIFFCFTPGLQMKNLPRKTSSLKEIHQRLFDNEWMRWIWWSKIRRVRRMWNNLSTELLNSRFGDTSNMKAGIIILRSSLLNCDGALAIKNSVT